MNHTILFGKTESGTQWPFMIIIAEIAIGPS